MLFNVLCGNRDDHLKNHAMLYDAGGWRLAPAFDVVAQAAGAEPVQAIAVGALGGLPTVENCLSRCGEFGLSVTAANEIAGRVAEVMRGWRKDFRACGVPETTIRRLARAFAPVAAVEQA
jgi:serine/threonine-protein kinase HipA